MSSTPRTDEVFLALLREHGARHVKRVRFRPNRSTIWSLTQHGTVLNLHVAYRSAPEELVRCLAVIANEAGSGSAAYRAAARTVRNWPGIARALQEARDGAPAAARVSSAPRAKRCAGTPEQRRFVRRLYRYLNATRFENTLPDRVPLRLSDRMTTRLGQMVGERVDGKPRIVEIALNVDLLLEGNAAPRLDTMLHEMAHVGAFLVHGERGHGRAWRAWAERAGCTPRARARRRILRRRRGTRVTGVPALPAPATQLELAV
jgi:hypothetical protein